METRESAGERASGDILERVTRTLVELAGVASVSGQEDAVRAYVRTRLMLLGLAPGTDDAGNLIVRVPAVPAGRDAEPPLLLNAHLDRVPPGLAHVPVVTDGVMRSDGTTNLGADDAAGVAIILATVEALRERQCAHPPLLLNAHLDRVPPGLAHRPRIEAGVMRSDGATNLGADDAAGVAIILAVVEALQERGLSHPPLLLLFTVGEEVGLTGAKAFDGAAWGAREGIVFDNAGEAGVVVTRAATYIAFDVTIHGAGGHPGKRLEGAVSAIEIFRRASYPWGSLEGDTTRISVGRVEGGSARNAVPRELRALGEIRTLADAGGRDALMAEVARGFTEAAQALGGSAEVSFDPHCDAYTVAEDEPLLLAWRAAVEARGGVYRTMTTFIGSDASALRRHIRAVTISTGAMNEHTAEEYIALAPLAELVETAVDLLAGWRGAPDA